MKRLIAFTIITIYLMALLRPIFPYIEYLVNKEYIATVLCINKDKPEMHCNGKCHLTKQLKKASEDENNSPSDLPKQYNKTDDISLHILNLIHFQLINTSHLLNFLRCEPEKLEGFNTTITPPPKSTFL